MVRHVRERARSQPAQGQFKVKAKARATENIQEKGTTTRTRLDLRIRMDSARWVISVSNVRELNLSVMSKRMMILRLPDWIEHLMCFAFKCKSVMMDSTELPSSSTRVFDGSEEPAGTHENFDQSTGEVLLAVGCRDDRPVVDSGSVVSTCPVDYATSVQRGKVHYSMNLESVLGEVC